MVTYHYLLLLLLFACSPRSDSADSFTLPSRSFEGNVLRIDGYYFVKQPKYVKHTPVLFLFRNGAILSAGAIKSDSVNELLRRRLLLERIRNSEMAWGRFLVEGDSITLEQREHTGGSLIAIIHHGIIDSDTTFTITKVRRPADGKSWNSNETYRFRKYFPKPDSVSEFLN